MSFMADPGAPALLVSRVALRCELVHTLEQTRQCQYKLRALDDALDDDDAHDDNAAANAAKRTAQLHARYSRCVAQCALLKRLLSRPPLLQHSHAPVAYTPLPNTL